MLATDTIAAISTAPGTGAIAVLRLSGPDARAMARRLAPALPEALRPRHAYRAVLADAAGPIDDALVTAFPGPASYTGEDVVEIGVHGSPYVQQRVLQALLDAGARAAGPGEFTRRAFLNGKLDLSQAEAVADMIASRSAAQHRLALHQLRGGFSTAIEGLRQRLIDFAALIELELDFSEEDVEFARRDDLIALLDEMIALCDKLIDSFRLGNALREGIPVAIIGAPNSGKSTLLNALLNEDRAIVSEIPGTTRDTVEETIAIDGVLFRFIDTAGIRRTDDTVEKLGMERSFRKAAEATIVVLLGDATVLAEGALRTEAAMLRQQIGEGPVVLPVLNKVDLPGAVAAREMLTISARTGQGMDRLLRTFMEHVRAMPSGPGDIVVTNARHVDALRKARTALVDAREGARSGIGGELLALDLRRAQHHLGEITGAITTDDLLGSIFGRFCIGK